MKKRFLAIMAVVGILALGACQEDPFMNELEQDTELNQVAGPDADLDNDDIPPSEGG